MNTADVVTHLAHPPAPATLEASGLSLELVTQLVLKTLHFAGELSGADLARRLGLSFSVLEPSINFLKRERHLEIAGGAMLGASAYRYRITDAGRTRAALYLQHNRYVGVAPVPLEHYRRYMTAFRQASDRNVTREDVRRAFSRLVVNDRVLDELGPAVNATHSIFIYGPPGNGKTVISTAIRDLLIGEIAIPHALEVEDNIVMVFDPVAHEELPSPPQSDDLALPAQDDARWVRCRRPMVMAGGELRLESLELHYNASGGFYRAPIQTLANGGLLVIDDFGRQRCSPRDLLNRWMVPLESRVDSLTLETGMRFEVPFAALVVFATNLKPSELVDEAFLRRIPYKVFALSPTVEDFIQIFANCCRERDLPFDRAMVEQMLERYYRPRKIALRACQPRDLINQALALAEYLGRPARLTPDLLEAACDGYFVDDKDTPAVYA